MTPDPRRVVEALPNGVPLDTLPDDVLLQAVKDRCANGTTDGPVLARELARRLEERIAYHRLANNTAAKRKEEIARLTARWEKLRERCAAIATQFRNERTKWHEGYEKGAYDVLEVVDELTNDKAEGPGEK